MQEKNAKLAKNSIALFLRMMLRLFVSVYTVRIILDVLGVEDYGIYNVVAGFTVMFGFLNSSMGAAASRFMSFDIGHDATNEKKNETFRIVVTIQVAIMVSVLFVSETAGLWFVNNKLAIPESRMFAANVIYHTSVMGMLFTIGQVPYNASIIAHENMNVYAYIEVLHSILLLAIVYALKLFGGVDRLILYGFLLMSVYAFTSVLYLVYCRKRFEECRIGFILNWGKIRPILSFSGWDLFANVGMSTYNQGMNVVLNVLGSAVLNAAAGIASQIYAALQMFSLSITTAVRPQIIKSFAASDFERMGTLINAGSRFLYLSVCVMCIPLAIKMNAVLSIWLVEVPDYAVDFARILLITQCIFAAKSLYVIILQATGEISKFSIIAGVVYLLGIPVAYGLMKAGCSPTIVYATHLLTVVGYVMICLYSIHDKLKYALNKPLRNLLCVLFYGIVGFALSSLPCYYLSFLFGNGIVSTISYCCLAAIIVFFVCFVVVLRKGERAVVLQYAKQMIHKVISQR